LERQSKETENNVEFIDFERILLDLPSHYDELSIEFSRLLCRANEWLPDAVGEFHERETWVQVQTTKYMGPEFKKLPGRHLLCPLTLLPLYSTPLTT
jgi:hypothetical protein